MFINWYGQTCFKIGVQNGRNGEMVELIIDPFGKERGLRSPRFDEKNIVLFSLPGRSLPSVFLINGPGEYDIKGIYIQGIEAQTKEKEKTTIYVIEAEGIRLCHLGFLGQKELPAKEIEEIGDIDILMLPLGDRETIGAKEAIEIMSQIEPRITIPMYYQTPGLKTKLDSLDKFLKTLGIKSPPPLPKLSIKKKDLPEDEARIVVLQP